MHITGGQRERDWERGVHDAQKEKHPRPPKRETKLRNTFDPLSVFSFASESSLTRPSFLPPPFQVLLCTLLSRGNLLGPSEWHCTPAKPECTLGL